MLIDAGRKSSTAGAPWTGAGVGVGACTDIFWGMGVGVGRGFGVGVGVNVGVGVGAITCVGVGDGTDFTAVVDVPQATSILPMKRILSTAPTILVRIPACK